MPISTAPHTAGLPWLAALAGTVAVQLGMPAPPPVVRNEQACVHAIDDQRASTIEHVIAKADFDRLRAEARQHAVPSRGGLRLHDVRPGSLFGELGFESGDLVVDIEGGDATRFHVRRGRSRFDIVLRIG
jgi:hypothetical protein